MPEGLPIREGQLLLGPLFSEPMQVETVRERLFALEFAAGQPPRLQDPARFPWQEITKVEHYRLNVDQLAS